MGDTAGLKHRHKAKMKDDEGLSQPLLSRDEPQIPDHDNKKASHTQIIAYPGPFNLQAFLTYVLECWRKVLDAVVACVGACVPGIAPAKMSLVQLDALERLEARAAEPFQPDSPQHEALLRRLWAIAFPSLPCTSLKSAQWKEMGWQGEDPATDIRGSGVFGLDCLLYLADVHPATWTRLMEKLDGQRSEWEYPFAAAGLNVQFMLCEVVGLSEHRARAGRGAAPHGGAAAEVPTAHMASSTAAGRGFLGLLPSDAKAFEEVFVASFEALDKEWLAQKASYMQFNQVLKAVKAKVTAALASRPADIEAFRRKLLGPEVQ